MMKYFTKALTAMGILCAAVFSANAQVGYNYDRLELGLSVIGNQVYGDADNVKLTPSASLNFTFSPSSPFVNYVIELQAGQVAGGDSLKYSSARQFDNRYTALTARVQIQAGQFIDYSQSQFADFLKNIYVSGGIGVVRNKIKSITRTSPTIVWFYSRGKNASTEFFIPARVGYEFKIFNEYNEPSIKIDLGAQVNFMLGENLDGYEAGLSRDIWMQGYIGVKFAIGGNTSYHKSISRY